MKYTKEQLAFFSECGKRGAKKQSAAMTPRQRSKRARMAAAIRWTQKPATR
jgi:hypothetical protein